MKESNSKKMVKCHSGYKQFIGIEELHGNIFVYGIGGQAVKYEKSKLKIAEYVGQKYGKAMWNLVTNEKETKFGEPPELDRNATAGAIRKWELKLKWAHEEEKEYKAEKGKVFLLIKGQCHSAMSDKLESLPKYRQALQEDDVVQLLKTMRELVHSTDNVQYELWTMQAQLKRFVNIKQQPNEDILSYTKRYLSQLEAMESVWGELIPTKLIVLPDIDSDNEDEEGLTQEQSEKQNAKTREKFLACHYLGSTDERYKHAVDDLNNEYLMGSVKYPESVPDMLHMLNNRRGDGNLASKRREAERDGEVLTSFHQQGGRIKCWKCGESGHVKSQCPKLTAKQKQEESERLSVLDSRSRSDYSGLQLSQLANAAFLDG